MTECPHGEARDSSFACPPCQGAGQPKKLRPLTPFTPTIIARFDSTCPACDGPIASGEQLIRDDAVWIHADCEMPS